MKSIWPIILLAAEPFVNFDRALAAVAIVLGVIGFWRSEQPFSELNKRADTMTEEFLRMVMTITVSYASFTKALTGVELDSIELPENGAFALLTSFYLKQQLHAERFTQEKLAELRNDTRHQVEIGAREYAEMLIKSGLGRLRDGVEFNPKLKK